MYLQVTGQELSADSPELRKEPLRFRLANKRVLVHVVLDARCIWNGEDGDELCFADVGVGSKYLFSTRVRGVLEGAHQVEIQLPSKEEAVRCGCPCLCLLAPV